MTDLVLDGNTLGERHKCYNNLLNETLANNKSEDTKLNPERSDVENLLKIDVANHNKNVNFILGVLKSEDLLYVTRALKNLSWLITNNQYAHIINPEYLDTQLYPEMTSKAKNKLLLHIRLNLKEESRVEAFFNYHKDKNIKTAVKWLPHCSISFIEEAAQKYCDAISLSLVKRLCRKSITVFEKFIKNTRFHKRDVLLTTTFFVYTNTEKYLDILSDCDGYSLYVSFSAKATEAIMKKCPDRLLKNLDKNTFNFHVPTFAKHLKQEDVKNFLLEHVKNSKLAYLFQFDNLFHFIKRIPKEERFDFVKKVFIEQPHKPGKEIPALWGDCNLLCSDFAPIPLCSTVPDGRGASNANIYRWYRFASFEVAFPDLKQLIRSESSPAERNSMICILLSCAGSKLEHIQDLLQFYNDKHINEPFKYKIQFVNKIISETDTHKYDEKSWELLNNLFRSMEVYSESENNVTKCINCIIVYKVLHDDQIPEVIEKKISFDTLATYRKKLNQEDQEKVFSYLYKLNIAELQIQNVSTENEFNRAVDVVEKLFNLLVDWNKELADYPIILESIKHLTKLKNNKPLEGHLSKIYNFKKSWRKLMFEYSIAMSPTEEACLNALKHGPQILSCHQSDLEKIRSDDTISLTRLLSKLRVYWPESLALEWADTYRARLGQGKNHKSLVRGLCMILPHKLLLDILQRYAPNEPKINWADVDELELSLRKYFAKNMHLARPLLPPDMTLSYAKGDYLQYTLPSIMSIFYDISCTSSRNHIQKLLDSPVSLQKHGIRLAFIKLKTEELKQIFSDIWKKNKNTSIRAVLFQQTYNLLCKEKALSVVEEIWQLLSMFIENLSPEENKQIFILLGKVSKVPLCVRPQYCMKSYKFLKSLPPKSDCENIISQVIHSTRDIMEHMDSEFMAEILLEPLSSLNKNRYKYGNLLSAYLLCCKDEATQVEKYEKVLVPFIDHCIASWEEKEESNTYVARTNLRDFLKDICNDFEKFVLEKEMIFPVVIFAKIRDKVQKNLILDQNYVLLTSWDLKTKFVEVLNKYKNTVEIKDKDDSSQEELRVEYYDPTVMGRWNDLYMKAAPDFGHICWRDLKEETNKLFSSIYLLFSQAFNLLMQHFHLHELVHLEILKNILIYDNHYAEMYLLVIDNMTTYGYIDSEEVKKSRKEIESILLSQSAIQIRIHYYNKYNSM